MSEPLPMDSWVETNLGNILQFNYGKSLPDRMRSGTGFPVYGSNGIVGNHDKSLTHGETLIIGRKGSVGEVHFSSSSCFPIDTTYYVDQFHGMPSRYWFYLLKHLRLSDLNKATAIPGLNREDAYRVMVPLPPLAEQKRIADKLDALLARVDRCRARLDRVPLILKRFRQAVLAAATSGQLTEDWREKSNLANYEVGNTESIFPASWSLCEFGEVLTLIDGDRGPNYPKKEDYHNSGHCLFLSTKNVREFGFRFDDLVFITKAKHDTMRSGTLKIGDVVITTRGTLGNVATYDESVPYQVVRINSGMLILRKKNNDLSSKYIMLCIASPFFINQLDEKRSGSAQPQIPASVLKTFLIPTPPLEEQHEIVRRVELLFAYADRLALRYQAARAQVERLTPALLAKAFRGELVAQDPTDEPAAVLLDRIRTLIADSSAIQQRPKIEYTTRVATMNKITEESVKETIRQFPQETFSFDDLRKSFPSDYDSLKSILFTLLDEPVPMIDQVFDTTTKTMHFVRRHQ